MTYTSNHVQEEITPWDRNTFEKLTSVAIGADQTERITSPPNRFPDEEAVLAIHWHPEHIPTDLVRRRLDNIYPQMREALIIPTQHNEILTYGDYAGAEVDCKASAFNRKVQILIHFEKSRIASASKLLDMIDHTRRYRATQLHDFLDSFTVPEMRDRLEDAADKTGVDADIVRFACKAAAKLQALIHIYSPNIPELSVKNKLFINYLNAHRQNHNAYPISRVVIFALTVKEIVKRRFSLDYFYEVQDVIKEVRSLGGCVVVPHPEQFWPILLADYDVDGYEVWNPQSREFSEFLIQTVVRKNRAAALLSRPLMIFMGDDTHMSEILLDRAAHNPEKTSREIGYQPAWRDPFIRKTLETMGINKTQIIRDYKDRLKG